MKTDRLLIIVIVMQALILAGQWGGPVGSPSVARADIPNPGERQLALLEEARQTNAKLDKLLSLLQSGDLQVHLAKSDDAKK
jgi:hypothetical protein